MPIYNKKEQFKLIKEDWNNLGKIDNQYEDVCIEAVKIDGLALEYVKEQTEEICIEAVKQDGIAIRYIEDPTDEICSIAVEQTGWALAYIENPSLELCLNAIEEDGEIIQYIENPSDELCIKIINMNARYYKYIEKPKYSLKLKLVKRNGEVIKYINNKKPELCFYAFLNKFELLAHSYIKKGIEVFTKDEKINNKIFIDIDIQNLQDDNFAYINKKSLIYLEEYLLKENNYNKYIFNDSIDTNSDILNKIALSNNELIIIDNGNITRTHKLLANKIIKQEDFNKEFLDTL